MLRDDDVEGAKIGNVFIIDVMDDVSCPQPSLAGGATLKHVPNTNTGTNAGFGWSACDDANDRSIGVVQQ